jgi:hypothetical protein
MKERIIFFISLLLTATLGKATAQIPQPKVFTVEPTSKLWVDGTSTLHSFTLEAKQIDGSLQANSFFASRTSASQQGETIEQMEITIPVVKLESGHSGMNSNMQEAMKADKFPNILYRLVSAEMKDNTTNSSSTSILSTQGYLKIAGVEKMIDMEVAAKRLPSGEIELTGSKDLLMTDFGIDPPTMMFGTIKTGDKITVRFDLTLAGRDENSRASLR